MYKDKEKAKQAARERQRRYRQSKKGVTKGVTSKGVTQQSVTDLPRLIPESKIPKAVVRPQVERDGSYADKTAPVLSIVVRLTWHWQTSQAYAEVYHRLTHWTLHKLKEAGQWIPVWREALG